MGFIANLEHVYMIIAVQLVYRWLSIIALVDFCIIVFRISIDLWLLTSLICMLEINTSNIKKNWQGCLIDNKFATKLVNLRIDSYHWHL